MQDPKVATNPGDFIEDVRIVHTKSKAGESVSIFFHYQPRFRADNWALVKNRVGIGS